MKEIGVKLSIAGNNVPIKSPVRSKFTIDGNLELTFKVQLAGAKGESEVKMIFDKKTYIDIADE